jgi:hypothetical protein
MEGTLLETCNRALVRLGLARMQSFTEDTATARAVDAVFEAVRETVQRGWWWRFALRRRRLECGWPAQTPGWNWEHRVPEDFLEWCPEAGTETEMQVEGDRIWTRGQPVELRYVGRVPDTAQWDPAFADVFVARLALELQPVLAAGADRVVLQAEYQAAVAGARRANAFERPPVRREADAWLRARL